MAHALRKSKHKSLQHINRNTIARTMAWVQSTIGILSSYLDNYIKECQYNKIVLSNFEYVIIVIPNDWCKHYTTKLCKQKNHFYFTSRTKCLNEQTQDYGHNNWIWVSKFYLEQLMSRKQDFNSSKNSSREFIVLIRALSKNDWHILLQIMMYSNHQRQQKYPFVKKTSRWRLKHSC